MAQKSADAPFYPVTSYSDWEGDAVSGQPAQYSDDLDEIRERELQALRDRIAHLETPQGAAGVLLKAHMDAQVMAYRHRNPLQMDCAKLEWNCLRAIAGETG